jgi:hypothetical protein
MSDINQRRSLQFSDDFVEAYLVENVRDFVVEEGVAINLSEAPMIVGGHVTSVIPAWKSAVLNEGIIVSARRIAVVRVRSETNLGGLTFDANWEWFGNRLASFPRTSPLYISQYDEVGEVQVDPFAFANQRSVPLNKNRYGVRINLWWAPTGTDCSMHNEHPFLEIHTQIHGIGRIQKFMERDQETMYEQITMARGYTHDPILHVNEEGTPEYPWHRYYSDTDCIWLAIELKPIDA